ncbi:MAG: hypothetical protein KIT87_00910 [Anaerolineae bacterium]|nr:hypothetical protein [Anaerolineae bacterium]
MSVLHLLSKQGDVRVEWDVQKAESGDPEALAAIAEAERILEEARQGGGTAFAVRNGEAEVLDKFDRTAEKIVVAPRIVGG